MKPVSQSRSQFLTPSTRVTWLYYVTVSGLLLGIILTLPQWSAMSSYPLSPIIPNFTLPGSLQFVLLLATSLSLVAGLCFKQHRALCTTTALAGLSILVLLDITRLQPWILHYTGILFLFTLTYVRTFSPTTVLDAGRIIVGGIYFWSGVQKMNPYFMSDVFPWFTEAFWGNGNQTVLAALLLFGLFVPFLEALFALGLFSKKTRSLSLLGTASMLVFVLAALGPFGQNWNSSVWPWNIALFLSAFILFYRTDFTCKAFVRRVRHSSLAILMFVLFWLVPIGNMFGYVDGYLAWSLYSGHVPEATLTGDQLLLETLSPQASDGRLPVARWSVDEINNAPYPATRVFESNFSTVCTDNQNDSSLGMEILYKDYFNTTKQHIIKYRCQTQ